jgi:hypothetical protein
VHGEQARGTHRDRGAVHSQGAGDPSGRHPETVAGEAVWGYELIVGVGQSDEHAGQRTGHRHGSDTGVLDGLPGNLQQQSMLRIQGRRLLVVDAEELCVEAGDVIEECAPPAEVVGHPAIGWNLGDQLVTTHERVPQQFWRIDARRKPARHANHCDRDHRAQR